MYNALLCIVVHPKRFTIMWAGAGSLLNHHQCAESTWMTLWLPQGATGLGLQGDTAAGHTLDLVLSLGFSVANVVVNDACFSDD